MLRRLHVPEPYFWIMMWFILALLLLVAEAMLFPQAVMTIAHPLRDTLTPFFLRAVM